MEKRNLITKKTEEVFEDWIVAIKGITFALDNPHRRLILELCKNKSYKVKEIRDFLGSSNKVVLDNLKILEEEGFIKREKKMKEKGRPVYIKSNMSLDNAVRSLKVIVELAEEEYFKSKKSK